MLTVRKTDVTAKIAVNTPVLCPTTDQSPTLYLPQIDEHYHSVCGALTESRHVYIDCGLLHRASRTYNGPLRVFEVGFGTGLNAALSAMQNVNIVYEAIELYPLDDSIIGSLDFGAAVSDDVFRAIHKAPWDRLTQINDKFSLHKIYGDFTWFEPTGVYDVIYMDAFAPEKQPEMWSDNIIRRLAAMLAPGGIMTTYCAKGAVRRAFRDAGMTAERLAGPPGGKREILRLTK